MARAKMWVYNPHVGGSKIPEREKEETRRRILAYAEKHYAGRYTRLDIRFKGAFCYIDAYTEPAAPRGRWTDKEETREQFMERLRSTPTHLCRLRHMGTGRWSVAFFTYSHEKYEPAILPSGQFTGTPEEGFAVGATYLTE